MWMLQMRQDSTVKNFTILTKVRVPQKDIIKLGDGVSFIGRHAVLGAFPYYVR